MLDTTHPSSLQHDPAWRYHCHIGAIIATKYPMEVMTTSPVDSVLSSRCSASVTGLRATHQLGATHKLCVTHTLSNNQISVGGLTANEYALDWVPLC